MEGSSSPTLMTIMKPATLARSHRPMMAQRCLSGFVICVLERRAVRLNFLCQNSYLPDRRTMSSRNLYQCGR